MPLVNGAYPSLTNGVSQQPPSLRLPTQGEVQDNADASLVDGLGKRSPTEHIKRIYTQDPTAPHPLIHFYSRDTNEKYVLLLKDRTIAVWDLEGKNYPVHSSSKFDRNYLICDNPVEDFKVLTLGDTTFVVNTKFTCVMNNGRTPNRNKEALIWVKQALPSTTYTIHVGEDFIQYTTPASGDKSRDVNWIAKIMNLDLSTVLDGKGYKLNKSGNVIWIAKEDGTDFTASVSDNGGGQAITCNKGYVQRFSDLPPIAQDGIIFKIRGDTDNKADDYYVKFNVNAFTMGPGVWEETTGPGLAYIIDRNTMPRQLVRVETETGIEFQFKPVLWNNRTVGDDLTCPQPSFINTTIKNIFLHRNRLGFLTGSKIVMSGSGDLFNFFRGTTQAVLDDDPIDIEAAHPKAVHLRYGVPLSSDLLIFADAAQFRLTGGDVLSSKTAAVVLATEVDAAPDCTPVVVGSSSFFPFKNGDFAGMREMYVADQTGRFDSSIITSHVPKYIPGNIRKLAVSSTESVMAVLTDADPNVIYIYRWQLNGNDKVQSSWCRWIIADGVYILGMEFVGPELYLICERGTCGVFLEKIHLTRRQDTDSNYVTLLDRRTDDDSGLVFEYDATHDRTKITLPYKADDGTEIVVVSKDGRVITPIEGLTQNVGCGGENTLLYRQCYGCESGTLENVWLPIELGTISFRFDGDCYFASPDSPVSADPGTIAASITVFNTCTECETGEGTVYVQATLCSSGALVDIWVPLLLAPLVFNVGGVCHQILPTNPTSQHPGTIPSSIEALDSAPTITNPCPVACSGGCSGTLPSGPFHVDLTQIQATCYNPYIGILSGTLLPTVPINLVFGADCTSYDTFGDNQYYGSTTISGSFGTDTIEVLIYFSGGCWHLVIVINGYPEYHGQKGGSGPSGTYQDCSGTSCNLPVTVT